MSARGMWLDGAAVYLDDAHGWPTNIPARVAHVLLNEAKHRDDGRAVWAFRPFDRDTLQGAVNLLDQRDACTFTSAAGDCDAPAEFDLANPRPRCAAHKTEN